MTFIRKRRIAREGAKAGSGAVNRGCIEHNEGLWAEGARLPCDRTMVGIGMDSSVSPRLRVPSLSVGIPMARS